MASLEKTLAHLKQQNIVVLGLGLTGMSCVRFLHAHGVTFSVNDSREMPIDLNGFTELYPHISTSLGKWDSSIIAKADVLIVSPGIDLSTASIADAISEKCEIIGDVELFCRINTTPIIAVTGSNGKSTVVSLLAYLGESLGYRIALGGNIGTPVLDQLNETYDYIVLELSSFQLETLESMKALSASILNVSDDHLDRHKTLENYAHIKQKIYQNAKHVVINRDDKLTLSITASVSNSCVSSFGLSKPLLGEYGLIQKSDSQLDNPPREYISLGDKNLIATSCLSIAGQHNALNVMAALALGEKAGWSLTQMIENLPDFKGLAHRCERVLIHNTINWINDSKATNVGATLAALNGLGLNTTDGAVKNIVLIAGGDGKGADFSPLLPALKAHVKSLITLGKDGDKLALLASEQYLGNLALETYQVSSLSEAVTQAQKLVSENDTVLLSPACASIDMFTNYIERGECFVHEVTKLSEAPVNEGACL